MRILYLADVRFPLERANGIQTMQTCHALAARDHAVELLVKADTSSPSRDPFVFYGLPPQEGLTITRLDLAGPSGVRRFSYLVHALGTGMVPPQPDVVLTRDLGVAAAIVALSPRIRPPVVYESHGFSPAVSAALPTLLTDGRPPSALKRRRLLARERRVWQRAEGYVTITGRLGAELTRRFGPRDHATTIPDGVRLVPLATHPSRTRDTITVAYAGHLYPWKGVEVLLEALTRVPAVRGLIVGGHTAEPDLPRLRALTRTLGLDARVSFAGLVEPAAVGGWLAQADVLVLPNTDTIISGEYTSPLKLFEYMAAGKPILASDLPAIREVLRDHDNAMLVPPGDPAALAAGIDRLRSDGALAARLAARARADVEDYTWTRRAERLEVVLDAAVARH